MTDSTRMFEVFYVSILSVISLLTVTQVAFIVFAKPMWLKTECAQKTKHTFQPFLAELQYLC